MYSDAVVDLSWANENTALLGVEGANGAEFEVPPGSTITGRSWFSDDPLFSGNRDSASGTANPAVVTGGDDPPPIDEPAVDGGVDEPAVDGGVDEPAVDGGVDEPAVDGGTPEGGGGFPLWLLLLALLLILLILLAGGGYLIKKGGGKVADGTDDDDGDDPRDTPPPVIYGEEVDQEQCDWELVVKHDGNPAGEVLRKSKAKDCCRILIDVVSTVTEQSEDKVDSESFVGPYIDEAICRVA